MKKKFLALLLCAGMFAEAAIPLSANDSSNIIVESDYGGTENGISVETDSEEMSTLDFLIPVEQKTEVPEGYIGIYTAEDLDNIRNDVVANYILMNNIDLSEYENWEPIHEYYGIFDGNGYTISNLVIDITNESVDYHSIGLFGGVYDAFIRNLSMQDCNIVIENAISDVGLISGSLSRSEIENCVASGRIEYINEEKTDTVSSIGGVSGYVIRSSMQNILCDVNMNVNFKNAPTCVGGMFGLVNDLNGDFIISNLLSRGNIIVFEDGIGHCGGVIGELIFYKTTSKVASITNTGDIQYTGNAYYPHRVGGIFGSMISYNSANVNVSNLLNTATIRSYGADCGGIIGSFHNPTGSGGSFETSVSVIDFSHIYNSGTLNCSVERDSSNSNNREIGGLFGEIVYPGTESSVDGCSYVDITISDSYNSGDIHATVEGGNFETYFFTTYYISGIVGMGTTYNRENDENSYNHLQLEKIYNVGNLFVSQDENEDSTYRTNIHDIIGLPRYFLSDEIGITSCYYPSNSVANCIVSGCSPLSDSEMQSASSFVGFDFDTVWEIGVTEGYPYPTLRNNPHSGSNKPTPSENVLVGKTFTQSTLRALGYDTIPADYAVSEYPPFLQFTNENSGIFYIVNSEFGYPVNFTYTLAGDLITITPSDAGDYAEGRFGQATELVMQMTEDGNLKVKSYSPEPTDTNNYAIGWTTYDDIFLLKDIPSVKPTVSNMPSDYQINLGESFDLSNVTVTAGNGGKLNKVTLKHNLTGTTFVPSSILVAYQSSSITLGDNFILSGDNYPLNTVGTHEFIIYASADNYTVTSNAIMSFAIQVVEPTAEGGSSVICNDPVEYAGNYRSFTVTFDTKPTSAYLQFDNQNDPSEWLDDAYCAGNALFCINPNDIVEKDGRFVYETEFRIHSEGLARENYMRKVRVVADYAGKKVLSAAQPFQVNPIPAHDSGNTIGNEYQQISTPDTNVDKPVIKNVANLADENGRRILSVLRFDCDAAASPFFWWESDCGTFYKISDDFRKVGFIPNGSGTVTVYMGDGLGYVASYELTIQ